MTHPDQDIIDFLTKDLDLRAAPDWMIERARAFRQGAPHWRVGELCRAIQLLLADIDTRGLEVDPAYRRFALDILDGPETGAPPKDQNQ